jgi:DNA-binding response OmpR family regulator
MASSLPDPSSVPPGGPPVIAIVDDDPRIRDLVEAELQDEGYNPRSLPSAAALVQLVQGEWVDLVLLDLMMPGQDGISCTRVLRQLGYAGKIVIVTALNDLHHRQDAQAAGANAYILKPELVADLAGLIRTMLEPGERQEPQG